MMEKVRIALKAASMVMWLNMDELEAELKEAEEALEKQKAKNVIEILNDEDYDCFCPVCNNRWYGYNHCNKCGQKLYLEVIK